jgi:HEPN domain-containing protein
MKNPIVKEWMERGKRDLEVAKLVFIRNDYFDIVLFHLQQAFEKYLKGFLIQQGWKLKKIHDLEFLITEAMQFDKRFQKYLDFSRKLTAFYFETRYPPGPPTSYSKEEVEEMLKTAEEFINLIEKELNENGTNEDNNKSLLIYM